MTANGHGVSFRHDENVLKLDSADVLAQLGEYSKTYLNFTLYKGWILWYINYIHLKEEVLFLAFSSLILVFVSALHFSELSRSLFMSSPKERVLEWALLQ